MFSDSKVCIRGQLCDLAMEVQQQQQCKLCCVQSRRPGLRAPGHWALCRLQTSWGQSHCISVFIFFSFNFFLCFCHFAICHADRLILVQWLVVILLSGSDSIRRDKKLKLCPGRELSVCTLIQ